MICPLILFGSGAFSFFPRNSQDTLLSIWFTIVSCGFSPVTWIRSDLFRIRIESMMGNSEFSIWHTGIGGFKYTLSFSSISRNPRNAVEVMIHGILMHF